MCYGKRKFQRNKGGEVQADVVSLLSTQDLGDVQA